MSIDSENKKVNIKYLIDEGPKVYINKIIINGNTRTTDKVIRRQLAIAEGDSYSKYLINYSKNYKYYRYKKKVRVFKF